MKSSLRQLFRMMAISTIRLYQYTVSPLLGQTCRFWPSCSHYAIDAFKNHPIGTALYLTARRLMRCNGFFSKKYPYGGIDEVPSCPFDILAHEDKTKKDEK